MKVWDAVSKVLDNLAQLGAIYLIVRELVDRGKGRHRK